jgi:hypothetical protein
MGNGIKFLIGATAAGILFNFLNKKKAALENIGITKIDVAIDLEKTKQNFYLKLFYNLKLKLYNSAGVNVTIKGIEAKFYLNGIEFAEISNNLKTIVLPKSENTINISASVQTASIVNSILDIISEKKAMIEVRGSLLTDLGLIEFREEKIV